MKKRILALALVIVTLVLTLTGCAYRYDKKDLSKLATVDATAFEAFLKEIEIEGHDFGAFVKGDNARDDKVLAEIDGILAEKETTDVSTGNYGIRQKITYAFYCTYVVEEEGKAPVTHIFNTSTMASKSTKNFLSIPVYENGTATNALESDDALTKAIFNAIKDKDVKTYKYETKTEDATEIAEGALVFATYKYTYMAGEEKKTVEVKCAPLTASKAEAATKIEDLLGGKKISDIKAATDLKFTDATLGECTVESLSIDFVVSGGQEVKVDFEIEAEMNVKDIANVSVKIPEDAKVTYHVYPVNAKAIPEQTAQNVVRLLYLTAGSESITTETLSCFGDLGMKELIEDFLSLKKTYETTKAATGEEGAKAAKEAYEAARKALPDKLVNVKSGADEVIMYDYKASVYDDLEAEYDEAIRSQLTAAIWAWAEENITVDDANLPKSAIKEAKKRIIAGHKYTYHTAKYSPSGDSKGASADDAIVYADGKDYPACTSYSDYWDFETDTIDVDLNGDKEVSITLYAGWVPYYSFDYYYQQDGQWTKYATTSFDYKATNAEGSTTSDRDTIFMPKYESGAMNYKTAYSDGRSYDFPQREGYTFDSAYLDSQCTQKIDQSFTHQGSVDLESGKAVNSVQNIYVKFLDGVIYKIQTAEELSKNGDADGIYYINSDLDFTSVEWPNALKYNAFEGQFYGNGHKISNLNVTFNSASARCGGLFGSIASGAVIKDLTIENLTFDYAATGRINGGSYGLVAGDISNGADVSITLAGALNLRIGAISLNTVGNAKSTINVLAGGDVTGLTYNENDITLTIYGKLSYGSNPPEYNYNFKKEVTVDSDGYLNIAVGGINKYDQESYTISIGGQNE